MQEDEQKWDGHDRRTRWAFKREVSIGNLLSIAALAAPLLVWGINMEKRTSLIESFLIVQRDTENRQERQAETLKAEIRAELSALNAKFDRILERGRQ